MRSTRCLSLGAVVAVVALAAGSGVAAASPCAIGACTAGPMNGTPPTVVGPGSTFDGPVAPDPAPEPGSTFDGGIPAIVPGPGHNPEFGPVPADGTNPISIAPPGFGPPPSDATNPVSIAPQPQGCGPAADQTVTATNAKAAEAALICLINNARLAAGL